MNRPDQATNFGLKMAGDNSLVGRNANPVPFAAYRQDYKAEETDATRLAEKIVVASYLNVAFLNDHLSQYGNELILPTLGKNVLYLAYTIEVKPEARFNASHLRNFLEINGVETKAEFKFHSETVTFNNKRCNSIQDKVGQDNRDISRFCLGVHQDLTIIDLSRVVQVFDQFFGQFHLAEDCDA